MFWREKGETRGSNLGNPGVTESIKPSGDGRQMEGFPRFLELEFRKKKQYKYERSPLGVFKKKRIGGGL